MSTVLMTLLLTACYINIHRKHIGHWTQNTTATTFFFLFNRHTFTHSLWIRYGTQGRTSGNSCSRFLQVRCPSCCCCCCDSPATRLPTSVVQVKEVCDRRRVVPQVLRCELRRVAWTVEQMLYRVWCHSTLRTNIWYATGDAGLVAVQEPTVTGTQLGKCGTDRPREQIFERRDIRWRISKDSVWYKIRSCIGDCLAVEGA